MKNAKRFLSFVLTVLMVSGCLSVFASAASPVYGDVDTSDDYAFEIGALNVIGLMRGKTESNFGYNDGITRRQMAILMARMMSGKVDEEYEKKNFKGDKNTTPFRDLDATGDYYGAIAIVNKLGIVNGTSPTSFDPNSGIMYRDALTMLVRALGYDTSAMKEGYPWSYVTYGEGLGLTKGMTRSIGIDEKLTRAEVAKLIFNAFLYVKCKDGNYLRSAFDYAEPTVVTIAKNQYAVPEGRTAWQGIKLTRGGWSGKNPKLINFEVPVTDLIQSGGISVGSQMEASMVSAFTFASDTVKGGSFGDFYLMLKKSTPISGVQTKTECINLGKIEPKTYSGENGEYTFIRFNNFGDYRLVLGGVTHRISDYYPTGSVAGALTWGSVLSAYDYVGGTSHTNDSDGYYKLLNSYSSRSDEGKKAVESWLTSNGAGRYATVTAYDFDFDGSAEFVIFNKSNIGRVRSFIKTDGMTTSMICSRFTVGTANLDAAGAPAADRIRTAEVEPSNVINLTESKISDNSIVVWQYDNLTGKVIVSHVIEEGSVKGKLTRYELSSGRVWIDGSPYYLMVSGLRGADAYGSTMLFGGGMSVIGINTHNLASYLGEEVEVSLFGNNIVYIQPAAE